MDGQALGAEIDGLIGRHWGAHRRPEVLALKGELREGGFCLLPRLLPPGLQEAVAREVAGCIEQAGRRRDLRMASTADSPRRYLSVERNDIFVLSTTIPRLYRSDALIELLSSLTGEPELIPTPYRPEEIVINCMQRADDEHGWHWDDYRYSLVWVLQAPRRGNGGEVQFVRDTFWNKQAPQVAWFLQNRPLETRYVESGDAYLIRGDMLMHRVSPLLADDTRIIVCFTYAGADELQRVVSHETIEELYPASVNGELYPASGKLDTIVRR